MPGGLRRGGQRPVAATTLPRQGSQPRIMNVFGSGHGGDRAVAIRAKRAAFVVAGARRGPSRARGARFEARKGDSQNKISSI